MTTADYEPNMVLSSVEYKVVGTRPIRHDGHDKVTGRALYGADFTTAGLLQAKVLRSPHAHARIVSIDPSKALAQPGVRAVVTASDLPPSGDNVGAKRDRDNVLASDKVLYKGHAVAGVAALSAHEAEEAVALIEVEYEVLPPVITVEQAMAEGATLLHDDLFTSELGEQTDEPSNVAEHFQHRKGDLDKGFAEADVIVEREYRAKTVHQGYIEPHNATALWNSDGRPARVVQHAGLVHGARRARVAAGHAGIADPGHSDGDRRRIRWQDPGVPGACGRVAVEEDGPSGEDGDEPRRRLRGVRPDLRLLEPSQDRREARRHDYRRRGGTGLRGWRLPRLARGRRRHVRTRALRHRERRS